MLSKILDYEANTSTNVFKFLELGIYPLRFELMKRKTLFLHYILQQDKSSMIYKVFEATYENPLKNDFVKCCENYLKILKIDFTFEKLGSMSTWAVQKLVKLKTKEAAFLYLKQEQSKQSKISHIKYDE